MAAKKKEEEVQRLSGLYTVVGTDDGQVREAALRLSREKLPASANDMGLEIVEGEATNSEEVETVVFRAIEAMQTYSLFGGGKLVWLKGATFLADTVVGRAEATQMACERLLNAVSGGLPPDVVFLLSATEVDKRRSFWLKWSKMSEVYVFDLADTSRRGWEAEIEAFIHDRCAKTGLRFEPGAIELFVSLAGERSDQVANEVEKLDLYLGPQRRLITQHDIRTLVPLSREGIVFELGNAIGSRQIKQALPLLDHLLGQGETAVGILLAAIIPKVRNLLLAHDLIAHHRLSPNSYQAFTTGLGNLSPAEVHHLPRKKDGGFSVYPLFLAAQECRNFSGAELRLALEACLEANRRLVTSALDPKVVLSQLLVRLLVKDASAAPSRKAA
jgi:DNA polymerase III subunit delta